MSFAVDWPVFSRLGRSCEGFDETKIHGLDQTCAGYVDGILPLRIVLCFADHTEDFQHLTLNQFFGQLEVVRVEHVVDYHQASVLDTRVGMET